MRIKEWQWLIKYLFKREIILNFLKILLPRLHFKYLYLTKLLHRFSHAVRLKSTLLSCQNSSISPRLRSCRFVLPLFVAKSINDEVRDRESVKWMMNKQNKCFVLRSRSVQTRFYVCEWWWKWIRLLLFKMSSGSGSN